MLAGCFAEDWTHAMYVPRVPNPVLLGPVDRIGGHRSVPEAGRAVDVETGRSAYVGGGGDTPAEAIPLEDGTAWAVTATALQATAGDPRADVHVESMTVGDWEIWLAFGNGLAARSWVRMQAKVPGQEQR